ncbi:hypothetical protein SMKC057_45670 [Serratia marcescens]|nr:hypothetical protein SMKC057_45670 [Serratia marcescens]
MNLICYECCYDENDSQSIQIGWTLNNCRGFQSSLRDLLKGL